MAVKIAPSPRQQFEDANGAPYAGGKLFTYAAGSSTKQATYTDSTGNTANTNPIVLDSAGRTPYGVWLTAGLNYKFVLALSTDTDPPGSPIFTEDNIAGTNDTTTTVSQWTASSATPTYINATSFSLVGDKTADFHVGRRLKFTVTAGTVYGVISETAYTTLTTVSVVLDSGSLDSGLSAVELSILTNTGSALPGYIKTLSGLTAQQATDLAAVSAFVGGTLDSATAVAFQSATATPLLTAVASTSGTSIDFTSVPSGTKKITVLFSGVSTNATGSANIIVQLGDSGGIETTGYTGITSLLGATTVATATGSTAGFNATAAIAPPGAFSGSIVIVNINGNEWIANTNMGRTDSAVFTLYAGNKTLTAALDRFRVTTDNGTDAFDAGTINVIYE